MNQPFSGGWRFGDRPTSVEALYQNPQAISNDFLKKVAALGQDPAKQGLLDQATTATPLTGLHLAVAGGAAARKRSNHRTACRITLLTLSALLVTAHACLNTVGAIRIGMALVQSIHSLTRLPR